MGGRGRRSAAARRPQPGDIPDRRPGRLGPGLARQGVVTLDRTADGYGWFVDPTPGDDSEFARRRRQPGPRAHRPAVGGGARDGPPVGLWRGRERWGDGRAPGPGCPARAACRPRAARFHGACHESRLGECLAIRPSAGSQPDVADDRQATSHDLPGRPDLRVRSHSRRTHGVGPGDSRPVMVGADQGAAEADVSHVGASRAPDATYPVASRQGTLAREAM